MVTNYYSGLHSTTPIEEKSHYHTAAKVEIGMILACVLVSFLVLIYDLGIFFQKIKEKYENK